MLKYPFTIYPAKDISDYFIFPRFINSHKKVEKFISFAATTVIVLVTEGLAVICARNDALGKYSI